jgi:hypothetical protein
MGHSVLLLPRRRRRRHYHLHLLARMGHQDRLGHGIKEEEEEILFFNTSFSISHFTCLPLFPLIIYMQHHL